MPGTSAFCAASSILPKSPATALTWSMPPLWRQAAMTSGSVR
ncbi:hypothetical protein [Pseudonocardia terrae]|nr:hypothetical protein [Pseudonocardia terrae]